MEAAAVTGHRLAQQRLSQTEFTTPAEVVGWLGAVQAQDYPGAKWSLGMRMAAATDEMIEQAVDAGQVLRTHVLRPTWHFVTPQDIRWMLELTGPRVEAGNAFRYRQLELDEAQRKRGRDLIASALAGGQALTRGELAERLEAGGLSAAGQRGPYLVMNAELEGLICSGPRRGKEHTYALLEERVPHAPRLVRDEALGELVRRYFTGHGPATIRDFTWWSGLTVADAKRGLQIAGADLAQTEEGGQTWYFAEALAPLPAPARRAYLLPTYDEFLVGYHGFGKARDGGQAGARGSDARGRSLNPRFALNGQIAGAWQRTLKKGEVQIDIAPIQPLSDDDWEAVHTAALRYGEFVQQPVQIMSTG